MTPSRDLTLMAVGDVLMQRSDPMSIFGDTLGVLAEADVLLGNQEAPASDRGEPMAAKRSLGSGCLRAPPASIEAVTRAGFTAMTLANNHMMDFGPEALLQTVGLLRCRGIATAGGGADDMEAHAPAVIDHRGVRIAMLGYTTLFLDPGSTAGPGRPGVATIRVDTQYRQPAEVPYQPGTPAVVVTTPDPGDMARLAGDIAAAKEQSDLAVVQFHWGVGGYAYPHGYMKELARFTVDAGADLIIGNHAHVPLGLEVYRGALIAYGLNRFAMDISPTRTLYAEWWPTADESLILKSSVVNGAFDRHSLKLAVFDAESNAMMMAGAQRRASIGTTLARLSEEFGTMFTPCGDELMIGGPAPGTPPPLRAPGVLTDELHYAGT